MLPEYPMAENRDPFFVVGSQRSGTTMLRLMLNQHSRFNVPFETAFIPDFHQRIGEFGDLANRDNIERLLDEIANTPFAVKGNLVPDRDAVLRRNPNSYKTLLEAIFGVLAEQRGKVRWGDKTPSYIEHMDVLWSVFPNCKFIHLIRDGRDVALSLRGISWGSQDMTKLARDWRWKVMLGRKMGAMIPQHYLEVHYETLVSQPVETLRRICDFLGEPFEFGMLRYHESGAAEMPAASMQWHTSSVSAPDPRKVQSWRQKMTSTDRIVYEEIAGDALQMFGYELSQLKPTLGSRIQFARYALLGHA